LNEWIAPFSNLEFILNPLDGGTDTISYNMDTNVWSYKCFSKSDNCIIKMPIGVYPKEGFPTDWEKTICF